MKNFTILAMFVFISNTALITAQTSTETFETETGGYTSFTDNGYTFNIVSHSTTFYIQDDYPGTGWNGTANDDRYIDNSGTVFNDVSPSFSITSGSKFTVSKFWIFLSSINLNQSSTTGTLIITGKLGGVTKFTTTKTSGFNTTYNGSSGTNNGYTLIDLTSLNGQNYSNIAIDELQLQSTGGYVYMGLDALTWAKVTTLGVTDDGIKNKTTVYPNPTTGIFYLNTEKDNQVSIYNQSGNLVKSVETVKGENELDITELSIGVYIIKTASGSHKIIKK